MKTKQNWFLVSYIDYPIEEVVKALCIGFSWASWEYARVKSFKIRNSVLAMQVYLSLYH